ncbi:MAG TPA: SDR family NAD(P)-dependent oxidoreductase [Sphingobium sp.]
MMGNDPGHRAIWQMQGKRVVIVGGGQQDGGVTIGNGRAISLVFAEAGAQVLVVDHMLDRAVATARLIEDRGGTAVAMEADVRSPAACQHIIDQAVSILGGIDVLINNVGIVDGDGDGGTVEVEVYENIMATNLRAAWLTSKAALSVMRGAGGGAIINISSLAALNVGARFAYGLSKSALNAMTARMACENAKHNIRINAVMPGLIMTPAFDTQLAGTDLSRDEFIAERASVVPLKRLGTAWDVAYAALFLGSDHASFVTGAILPVDGGQHAVVSTGCGG